MRLPILAIASLLLTIVAFILAFLCIFAGSKTDLLQNYSLLTLNISRIGQDLGTSLLHNNNTKRGLGDIIDGLNNKTSGIVDSLEGVSTNALDAIEGKVKNVTQTIENEVQKVENDVTASIAKDIGLKDFYSIFVRDYCQGYYTPSPVKNATVHSISKNVTACTNPLARFHFNPTEALVTTLNETGLLTQDRAQQILKAVHWPDGIQTGLNDVAGVFNATFILYCVGIAFAGLTLLGCMYWAFKGGKISAFVITSFASLAFLFTGVASALCTVVAVKGTNAINKYGNEFGIQGQRGTGFLGLTWTATTCLFLVSIMACLGICGGRKKKVQPMSEKP